METRASEENLDHLLEMPERSRSTALKPRVSLSQVLRLQLRLQQSWPGQVEKADKPAEPYQIFVLPSILGVEHWDFCIVSVPDTQHITKGCIVASHAMLGLSPPAEASSFQFYSSYTRPAWRSMLPTYPGNECLARMQISASDQSLLAH